MGPIKIQDEVFFTENINGLLALTIFEKKVPSDIFDRVVNTPLASDHMTIYGQFLQYLKKSIQCND